MKFLKIIFSRYMFKSFLFFISSMVKKKKFDVILVNSVVFNRSKGGENTLFSPFINFFKKNKIKYLIIEDIDLKGEYNIFTRNNEAIPYDFIKLTTLLFRKILYFKLKNKSKYEKDLFIAKLIKELILFNLSGKVYITLLWNNVTLWRQINPNACIIDYQHGVILKGHEGYIFDNKPPEFRIKNKIITLVYSDVFKNILIKNDISNFYNNNNVINIGINTKTYTIKGKKNQILFTLQITPDFNFKINNDYINYVNELNNYFRKNQSIYKLILKHHPRYNHNSKFKDIKIGKNIKFSNLNTLDLLSESKIHITFNSTSAIEAAFNQVPTIFFNLKDNFSPIFFIEQYNYPYPNLVINNIHELDNAIKFIENNYESIKSGIYEWGEFLYNDFNYKKLKLILDECRH